MSKGSKRRPGTGYEENWEKIFNGNRKEMDSGRDGRKYSQDDTKAKSDWSFDQRHGKDVSRAQRY